MDATGNDPGDETWEIRSPRYRVSFFDGIAAEEFELADGDVVEALAWAEERRGARTYALYACVPNDGLGLVLLAGTDPDDRQRTSLRAEPFVSTLVLATFGPATTTARAEALAPGRGAAPARAVAERILRAALAPVLRDVRTTTGVPEPEVDGYGWVNDLAVASVMLGGGSGVSVAADASAESQVAAAADQVQGWVIEELWNAKTSTNWPPCPRHRTSHPLRSVVHAGVATWSCPTAGTPISPIGSLSEAEEDQLVE